MFGLKKHSKLLGVALLALLFVNLALALQISSDKSHYFTGDKVTISLSDKSQSSTLIINSGKDYYKFLGALDEKIFFYPQSIGTYSALAEDGSEKKEIFFNVLSKVQPNNGMQETLNSFSAYLPFINLDKDSYSLNDEINITINHDSYDKLVITDGTDYYKFLGQTNNMLFIPKKAGNYIISLYSGQNILQEKPFEVLDKEFSSITEILTNTDYTTNKYIITKPVRSIKKMYLSPFVKDSKGKSLDYDLYNNNIIYSNLKNDILVDDWSHDFTLQPKNMKIKQLSFKDIDLRAGFDLGLEELSLKKINIQKEVFYSYAIDPEKLNFSYARVTVTATANELYKCALWNFTQQLCLGSWEKVMDITPGNNYTILLTPNDPAYAETTYIPNDCYYETAAATCVSLSDITSVGGSTYEFSKRSGSPLRVAFQDTAATNMDQIVQCTIRVKAYDSKGNIWTLQPGNYTANTWSGGTGITITADTYYVWNCTSYFSSFTNDYSAFNDFGFRLVTADAGRAATAYIDYAEVIINYSLKDTSYPYYSSIITNPVSPAVYNPSNTYQFNTTWQDNEAVDTVKIQHNFTGSLNIYPVTGNTGSIYYYNYGNIAAGTYSWRMIANDTSNNTNQTSYQSYIINKATTVLGLTVNGVSNNITIERKSSIWINGSIVTPTLGNLNLFLNSTLIDSGLSPVSNYSTFNNKGFYQAKVQYITTQNYSASLKSYFITVDDTIPPSTITGLIDTQNSTNWILWNWSNPVDDDFNHVEIWIDGVFYTNISSPTNFINVTDRNANTTYQVSIRTVDNYNNINFTWVNDSARTQISSDTTPPVILNLQNTSITDSSVNISFETDEGAKPKVFYGTSPSIYTQSVSDEIFDTIHYFIISGLFPSTTYYYVANATDAASNSIQTIEYSFTTLADSTPPSFSNIKRSPPSPATYNPLGSYMFNTTWTDNGYIDTIIMEHNFTGVMENYSISGNLSSEYYYIYGPIAAGTYSWRMKANDSLGNLNNFMAYQPYVINKASSVVNLLLNNTDGNFQINETQNLNISGYLVTGKGNITLWRSGLIINNGTSPLTTITPFNTPGSYLLEVRYSGNKNYSSSSESHTLTVNDVISPNITLISPPNSYEDLDGDVVFSFNVTDSGTVNNCSIYINDTLNYTKQIFTQGLNTFTINNIVNGFYDWYVSCNDSVNNVGTSTTLNFSIRINEFYPVIYPISCVDTDGTCTITNINISDVTSETHTSIWKKTNRDDWIYINYSLPNIPLGSTIHWLNMSYYKYQDTNLGYLSLEWKNTTSGSWIQVCQKNFVTAGIPPTYDNINCNFNDSGNSWPPLSAINSGLQLRSHWYHSGTAAATIAHGTQYTSIFLKYTEDATPPNVELTAPADATPKNVGDVIFEYRPSDANLFSCSLWGDFNGSWSKNKTNSNPTSGSINFFTVNLNEGYYTWNVECVDIRNNTAFATQNWHVNITNPNLEVISSYITFSNTSPKENQVINISSIIKNKGNVNASIPFIVQFFDGNPELGGTQIGLNQTINYLDIGLNQTLNQSFIIPRPGPINVYVVVDAPLSTNGSVKETDETNNIAYKTLNVPVWFVNYGNISANIELAISSNKTLSSWFSYSPFGNVYAVETGSNINWDSLQALGRKIDNSSSTNDFNEVDIEMNMSSFVDGVNNTYTYIGLPIALNSFSIYNKVINNVPIRNSTNSSSFITGILWDTSDGGTEYNGSQDIIFITKINQNQVGQYGNYDYEMALPALFRNYHEVVYSTISYYTEIN